MILVMQRLTTAAPIDEATLKIYEETVAIIHRHLPPSLALLYATARRSSDGYLEWWTERQGLAKPFSALSETEQLSVQGKRQQYQDILKSLIDQLVTRGEEHSAQALQTLLTHSHDLDCYSVGGEPVLINWAIVNNVAPVPVVVVPWWRRFLPWLLLLLVLLLIALAWWWSKKIPAEPPLPAHHEAAVATPVSTELTQANPSINLEKRKDFGRIKINLTWQQGNHKEPIDLDIAAFIRFKNGKISGAEALSIMTNHLICYCKKICAKVTTRMVSGSSLTVATGRRLMKSWFIASFMAVLITGKERMPLSLSMSPISHRLNPR